MSAPLYVVTAADAPAALRRLVRDGWQTREGFALPETTWDVTARRLALHGVVGDSDDAELAVLAAVRGAAVVVVAAAGTELGLALRADLARVGTVTSNVDVAEAATDTLPITDEQRALLARLADGETIAAAATAEFLSLRTANRRISQARAALGVRTTREAVLRYAEAQSSNAADL